MEIHYFLCDTDDIDSQLIEIFSIPNNITRLTLFEPGESLSSVALIQVLHSNKQLIELKVDEKFYDSLNDFVGITGHGVNLEFFWNYDVDPLCFGIG